MSENRNRDALVSFCCLGYNHGSYIESCIQSIWDQQHRNVEILILDDGSNDGSRDILIKCEKRSPVPIHLILQKNSGNIARNLNTLINRANGEFVFFIALDDLVRSDAISSKIELFGRNRKLAFVANRAIDYIDSSGKYLRRNVECLDWSKEKHDTVDDLLLLEHKYIGAFYLQGALFKKEIVDAVNGFDENLLGDDIVLRTKILFYLKENRQLDFELLEYPSVSYRQHENNIHKNAFRQVVLVKEWLNAYFPNDFVPDKYLGWIGKAIRFELSEGNLKNVTKLISILDTLNIKNERKGVIDEIFLPKKDYRFFLPYIFEIRFLKSLVGISYRFKILNIDILEFKKISDKKSAYFFGRKIYEI